MPPCLESKSSACSHAVDKNTRLNDRRVASDPEAGRLASENSFSCEAENYTASTPSDVSFSSLQDQ